MNAITDVANFFDVQSGALPVFTGTEADALPVWRALNATDRDVQWRKAAIAATLERASGSRTDCGAALTPIQSFCLQAHIGTSTCSRWAKTYRVYDTLLDDLRAKPLDPGVKRSLPGLLADDRLYFKHFHIGANYCPLPVEALIEARDNGLSANTMFRYAVRRMKQQHLLAEAADVRNDDDDPDSTGQVPTRDEARAKQAQRTVRLTLSTEQHRTFDSQVAALGAAFGTADVSATVAMAVARAFASIQEQAGEAAA